MIDLTKLARKNILSLKPYSSARDEYFGSEGIFLDANENSFGSVAQDNLNRYPDPHHRELKEKMSEIKKVNSQNIFFGNGSDEAIDLLIRAFCEPGNDDILIMPPTYGMYEVCAAVNDVGVTKVPLDESFEINVSEVINSIDDNIKLIFICSPNNPTGNSFNHESIESLLNQFQGLVIIDEAYIDFSNKESWLQRLADFNNLVVLQTFSKAWGLANIRLGMAYASSDIIKIMNKIKYPYNVNGVTQKIALDALNNEPQKNIFVEQILDEREKLSWELNTLELVQKIYQSDANFLLVKVSDAGNIYHYLIKNLVIVRDRSNVALCDNCLRITVGTSTQNEQLLALLRNYGETK
jgi:histidinol-phosphate aminotransferase